MKVYYSNKMLSFLVFHADMKVTDCRKKSAYVSALIVALVSIDQE